MITLINWNTVNNTQLKVTLQVHFYFGSITTSTHEANLLEVVTKNNLQSSARGFLFIVQAFVIYILLINFSKCTKLSKSLYINRAQFKKESIKG